MYIEELEQSQIDNSKFTEFDLWWDDLEEAGVDRLFVAFDAQGVVIGFQTVSPDGLCVAIEVLDTAQGQGVARALVEESGCWRPEDDQCPEFWEKMAEEFGW